MPRPTNKPPATEWERQKEVILSLAIKHSWREVAEKMEKEHSFVAIPDHYDAQMRAWGVHKNLKSHEWRGAVQRLDNIASRHQRKVRMRILGKIVSDDRLRRSRSRHNHRNLAVPDIVPSHVSFEILGADGEWTACTSTVEGPAAISISGRETSDASPPESRAENDGHDSDQRRQAFAVVLTEPMLDNFTIDALPQNISQDLNMPDIDFMYHGQLDSPLNFTPEANLQSALGTWRYPPGAFDLARSYYDLLDDLPFKRFQNELSKKGIDFRSLRPNTSATRNCGISECVTPFLRDIASCIARATRPGDMRQYIQPTLSLQAFQSLLPGEVSFEQHHHNLTLTATSLMLEPNFTQLLVFSVANGFAGLNQMPIAGIFKFFTRYGNLKTLFGQILQARSCHFAKSLAENFFKIAIEAQESDIITQLLDTRLVQVNDVVCLVNGQRLTAVGRAAQLRDLKTMKTMIRVGADVNKTYNPDSTRGGSLNLLIGGLERGETFPDAVQIIQTLLGAGAKFDVETLNDATRLRRHSNIALCLLLDLPPEYHMEMFARGTPSMITSHLEQEQAFEAIKHILEACNSHHKGQCLQTFENQVEWALVESARRGHVHVVRLLLPYSNRLTRLLSAAIRGGDRKVVDVILARNPGFDSPADSIERYHASNRTTPLAEAILTNKDDLIRLCETANALEHLHLEGHLQAALTAAATTGNSAYVEKLLQYGPEASDLSAALGFAILNSHEAISLRLITAGACFIDCPNGSDILFCALKQRNATLVRAILDRTDLVTGATYLTGKQNWFAEAVRWGDVSVMLDLHYTFPETRIKDAVYPESDTWENSKKFLYFLINLDLLDTSTFTQFLRTSILNGDEEMVYHLIELGAEPSDATCLSHAAGSQPAILRILLEHIPRSRKPRTKLGTFAVIDMIGRGVAGLESLEILLLSEIVDIRSFQFHHSPLGLAIKHAVYYRDSFPIVQRLLEAGCDPNGVVAVPGIGPGYEYYSNMTALLAAVSTHNIDLVRLLITFSAEVNTQASRGLARTPLQLAAELGCLEISQLLIKEGAQVNALPAHRGGGTALQLAAISGNCNIAAELLSHGADPEAPPSKFHGRWPIEGAAEHDRLDMVEYLLKVTVFNAERCRRAMELAQENGHMGCYDLILEHVQTQEGVEEMGTMGLAGFI